MTSIMQSGVSGLLSYQSALATVSNNIANASNEDYTRQSAEFVARPTQGAGGVFIGTGVELAGVRRVYDQFLTSSLFANTEAFGRLEAMTELGAQIDSILINADSGVAAGIEGFFDALSGLSAEPSSLAAREATLGAAEAMVAQFQALDRRFRDLEEQIDTRVRIAVTELNALAESLAQVNDDIARLSTSGGAPNDLLDRRDALLREMSRFTNVQTSQNADGTLNVLIGNGITLVRGIETDRLGVAADTFDGERLTVTLDSGAGPVDVSGQFRGGELGGLFEFRDTILTPARNELGRLAYALFDSLNEAHRGGMTLNGELGGDLFRFGGPQALVASSASPGLSASVDISDVSALTDQEYELRFDGTAWLVRDVATGARVAYTGSGTAADPLVINGVSVEVDGAAAGDRLLIRPAGEVIAGLGLATADPADLALAGPVITSEGRENQGSGVVENVRIRDPDSPIPLRDIQIEIVGPGEVRFDDTRTVPFRPGVPLAWNQYAFVINGEPAVGDRFTIEVNDQGEGDNRNALRLLDVRDARLLDGGVTTVENGFDNLVTGIASQNRSLTLSFDAQASLLLNAEQERLALSGVNLDEEAADLLRFQQAYSASAEVVRVAGELFDTLLGAVGR